MTDEQKAMVFDIILVNLDPVELAKLFHKVEYLKTEFAVDRKQTEVKALGLFSLTILETMKSLMPDEEVFYLINDPNNQMEIL